VKSLVAEQEVQSSSPAVTQDAKPRQAAQEVIRSQSKAEPKTPAVAPAKVDCYESCLDLAALFLARG